MICKENLVVSLTQNGTAQVIAAAFDNGSYDNCQLDRIQVRRMDSCGVDMTFPFGNVVDFQCCDVGQEVMVELGVWDTVGNFNSCMVRVQVQDKVTPTITCPPDLVVNCDTNLTNLAIFGMATVSGGACNDTPLDLVETRNLDNCGVGTITRTWTVRNTNVSCTQTITVQLVPSPSFNITRMPRPEIEVQCSSGINIENLGQDSLQVESAGCQLLAVSFNQRVFNTTGQCQEVLRTWEIIDWCRNPLADPTAPGYQLVTQVVRLVDTLAPTFTAVIDTLTVNTDHSECNATVTLPAFAVTDDCSNVTSLRISGLIGNSAGGFDTLTNATPGTVFLDVPVGTYTLFYTASDGCNNTTVVPLTILVQDNEGPTIFCDDLVTTLTLNPDALPTSLDRGWVTVWASDFNCKISDCNSEDGFIQTLRFPSLGAGQLLPPADTAFGHTFTCADLGTQTGDLWVRDASGNWDFVRVTVTIQDNMNVCPSISNPIDPNDTLLSAMNGMIFGTIETELGEKVEEVTVSIDGHEMNPLLTGIDGNYQFDELPMHNNYVIAPEKNIDPLNGVSTFDLVLISKHILGIDELDSPYKQIAADINRSGNISAFDLVQLRQLILNINTEFKNNNSWRFVDANYQFVSDNPEGESFNEVASIGDLSVDTEAHFIAVKIGDVNTNATANRGLVTAEDRTSGTLSFLTDEKSFKAGEVFNADFSIADLESCLLYTSPSPRDRTRSRMPSSA